MLDEFCVFILQDQKQPASSSSSSSPSLSEKIAIPALSVSFRILVDMCEALTAAFQSQFVRSFAAALQLSPSLVRVADVRSGSVYIDLHILSQDPGVATASVLTSTPPVVPALSLQALQEAIKTQFDLPLSQSALLQMLPMMDFAYAPEMKKISVDVEVPQTMINHSQQQQPPSSRQPSVALSQQQQQQSSSSSSSALSAALAVSMPPSTTSSPLKDIQQQQQPPHASPVGSYRSLSPKSSAAVIASFNNTSPNAPSSSSAGNHQTPASPATTTTDANHSYTSSNSNHSINSHSAAVLSVALTSSSSSARPQPHENQSSSQQQQQQQQPPHLVFPPESWSQLSGTSSFHSQSSSRLSPLPESPPAQQPLSLSGSSSGSHLRNDSNSRVNFALPSSGSATDVLKTNSSASSSSSSAPPAGVQNIPAAQALAAVLMNSSPSNSITSISSAPPQSVHPYHEQQSFMSAAHSRRNSASLNLSPNAAPLQQQQQQSNQQPMTASRILKGLPQLKPVSSGSEAEQLSSSEGPRSLSPLPASRNHHHHRNPSHQLSSVGSLEQLSSIVPPPPLPPQSPPIHESSSSSASSSDEFLAPPMASRSRGRSNDINSTPTLSLSEKPAQPLNLDPQQPVMHHQPPTSLFDLTSPPRAARGTGPNLAILLQDSSNISGTNSFVGGGSSSSNNTGGGFNLLSSSSASSLHLELASSPPVVVLPQPPSLPPRHRKTDNASPVPNAEKDKPSANANAGGLPPPPPPEDEKKDAAKKDAAKPVVAAPQLPPPPPQPVDPYAEQKQRLQQLQQGCVFVKHCSIGQPHSRFVRLSPNARYDDFVKLPRRKLSKAQSGNVVALAKVEWGVSVQDAGQSDRFMLLADITAIDIGIKPVVSMFKRLLGAAPKAQVQEDNDRSFTLRTPERSLELVAPDAATAKIWVTFFEQLLRDFSNIM